MTVPDHFRVLPPNDFEVAHDGPSTVKVNGTSADCGTPSTVR